MKHVVAVDPDSAGPQRVGDLESGVEVAGVHGSGETVCCRVSDANGVLLGLELGDGADGSENLLLHDLHVLLDIGEDGGLDEVALVTLALAANLDLGSGICAILDVSVTG